MWPFKIKLKIYHCLLWHAFPKNLWLRLNLYEKVQCLSCVWNWMGLKFLEREKGRERRKEGGWRKEWINARTHEACPWLTLYHLLQKWNFFFLFFFEGGGPLLLWSPVSKIYVFNIFQMFFWVVFFHYFNGSSISLESVL